MALAIRYFVDVAPEIWLQLAPPLLDTSHWTVGVGLPEAVASKFAPLPSLTVLLVGCFVTDGATFVSVSAPLRYGAAAATPARVVAASSMTARTSSATRRGPLTPLVALPIPFPSPPPFNAPPAR